MKRFFNWLFNRTTVYNIITDKVGMVAILELLYRDTDLTYERAGLRKFDDKSVLMLKITGRNFKRLIDKLTWNLNGIELRNISIYEKDSNVDLLEKRKMAA